MGIAAMNLFQIIKMVLWSFFGIRSRSGSELDAKAFRPAQVLGVAIVMAAAFIGILLTVAYTATAGL